MNLRARTQAVFALLALILVLIAPRAFAQGESRFTGTVLDPSGAAVPGATVVVKNERTGEEREAQTNASGRYVVTGLRPSTYTVRATLSGFSPIEYTGMRLVVGQDLRVDLPLKTAGLSEEVTVEGVGSAIDLSSASVGANVTEREVRGLPVNGRQMSQLMLQAPGSQNAGTGTWNDVRFSGRANQQNVIKFDGVEGSSIIDAAPGNMAGQISSPFKLQASLENVQEFRVESNNYTAEYGTGTGGQVNVVSKSGANEFRGSVFEYYRDESFDAPNYFDYSRNLDGSIVTALPRSKLNQHQFGASIGGPLIKDKAFFFLSYEGYRLDAGVNFVEGAPSPSAWSRAVPAVAVLRPGFVSPDAVLLQGVSLNPDFDIYQLQGVERVEEDAFSARLDYRFNSRWSSYARFFYDKGTQNRPEGVSGRTVLLENEPMNAVVSLLGNFNSVINEFKIGYNAPKAEINGHAPTVNGVDFSQMAINLTGSIANTGIAGQTGASGVVVPGGLVRASSATNGRGLPYDPYSIAFSNATSLIRGNHLVKFGADVRMIRMTTDQLGGTTYSYPNITAFLANQPSAIQYLGDISSPSVFNNGATGMRHTSQQYYVGYIQDQWRVTPDLTVNYGLRYDYYTPLKVRDNLFVKFNVEKGTIDPNTVPLHGTKKDSFQPRVAFTYRVGTNTVIRGGAGIFVGPGQGEDLIQPIESDRVSTTLSSGAALAYPINQNLLVANFTNNPNNRNYQPRAYAEAYAIPEKVYQYTASVQQELGKGFAATVAYVGSQGRNLFLRSVANNITQVITNPNPANAALVVREYSIVTRDAAGNVTGVQNPYAEIDYKTSGGHDSYNALMVSLSRRSSGGLALNAQYTLGESRGTSGGSNEANTAANNARTLEQFEYDNGYNNFDVRHTFNLSAIYSIPYGKGRKHGSEASGFKQAFLGGWDTGAILNARSGLPVPVQIVRPDVLYRDAAGLYFANPAAGRTAVINTPGGGASRNVRRPDLVPGVDPYIKSGGLLFLNPAAFAVPMPGTFGNLERNSIHGPSASQVDVFLGKQFQVSGRRNLEFRVEVFNILNRDNFALPVGTLPTAIPATSVSSTTLQPGQAYSAATAGSFGLLTSTVGRTVGLGTNRQIQFAVRVNF
jgi:hypothetical protein